MSAWPTMKMVFILSLFFAFAAQGKKSVPDENPFLTRVKRVRVKKEEPPLSIAQHIDILQQLPGITLNQQGGPLTPVDVKIRGLSGARLSVDLEGINLVDPINGLIDINDLPFFVSHNMQLASGPGDGGLSGKLSLQFPSLKKSFAISRIGFGSLKTGRAELIAGDRFDKNYDFLFATQGTTTAGNFLFSPTSIVADTDSSLLIERINNDQNRWVGLLKISERLGNLKGSTFLFAKMHEGGIAGMAMSPLYYLRGSHKYVTGIQKAAYTTDNLKIEMQWQARLDARETWQKNMPFTRSEAAFASTQVALSVSGLYAKNLSNSFTLSASGEFTRLLDSLTQRKGAGLQLKVQNQIPFPFPLTMEFAAGFRIINDAGIMPNGLVHFHLKPCPAWMFGLRLAEGTRAPTFSELYAPSGLVLGNPDLKPESSYETEIYGQWDQHTLLLLKLSAFYGFLSGGIFYFNRSAFEIFPINTKGVHRAGLETQIAVYPQKWLALEGNLQLNATQLISTQKPLPNVPGFSSTLTFRLGETEKICVWLKANYRSSTANNFFGTLTTPAYLLLDAFFKIPLRTNASLHFSVSNIFNNLDARDSNQFPLPGRTFFALLELTS